MAVEGLPENVMVGQLDALANWCRKNSLWPMPFATACCGIELMATGASRHDLARFGAETIEKLRIFHVLNGHQVRSYAEHFIRRP